MATYATVNKQRSFKRIEDKIYEEPLYDLSQTNLMEQGPVLSRDSFDSLGSFLPISSIYEAPALLMEEEGPRHFSARDVREVSYSH